MISGSYFFALGEKTGVGGAWWRGWKTEKIGFWWRVEGDLPFFWGKGLKYRAFLMKKIHGKRSFGLVFLGRVYYNVDRSGVKWFFVV
ncbi:MAG: hypothetical protein ACI4TP_03960 [Anaerotignum sp.]